MMDTKQMREEFETWTASHDYLGGVEVDRAISGNYSDVDMQHAWESWQASRAAVVIEFPLQTPYVEYYDDVEGGCFDYPKYLADVKAGIVAQGLQCGVKS